MELFSSISRRLGIIRSRPEKPCDDGGSDECSVGGLPCPTNVISSRPSCPTNIISSRPSIFANMFSQRGITPDDTTTQEKEPDLSDDYFSLERMDPSLELGSVYDVTSRTVIPGLKMWTPEVIEKERRVKALGHTQVEYKAVKYKDTCGTLTSLDTSLMETCGASDYIKSFSNTHNYQYIILIYKYVKRSEELQVNHLLREPAPTPPARGSHIITQINYADYAVFLLDVTSASFSEAQQNRGRLEEAGRALMTARGTASTPLGSTSPTLDSASTAYESTSMPGLTSTEHGLTSPTPGLTSPEYGSTSPTPGLTSPEYGLTLPTPGLTSTEHGLTSPTPEYGSTSPTPEYGLTSPTPGLTSTEHGLTSPTPGLTSTEHGLTSPTPGLTSTEYGSTSPPFLTSPEYDPNSNNGCPTSWEQQWTPPPPEGEEESSSSSPYTNIRFRVFRSDRSQMKEVAMTFQEALDTFRQLPRDFAESGSPGVPVSAFLYKTDMFTTE